LDYFEYFTNFSGGLGYLAVVGALLACGLGLPVPEDIILISGGYIAAEAGHSVWPMVVAGMVGILGGDSVTFLLGRTIGIPLTKRRPLNRVFTAERLAKVDEYFKKHGEKILMAARFMPGARAVTYFSAGAMGVPYWKFFLYDGLAAIVSAPLWVILGFKFGAVVVGYAKQFGWVVLGVVVVVALVWFVRRRLSPPPAVPEKPVDAPKPDVP